MIEISKSYAKTIFPEGSYKSVKIGLTLSKKFDRDLKASEIAKYSLNLYRLCKKIVEEEAKRELNGSPNKS